MRIIYGVNGEGMGHAIRSKPILEHLEKKHEVLVVCGGKAHSFLSKFFKTIEVKSLHISFKDNKVRNIPTLFSNIIRIPSFIKSFLSLQKKINDFKPDIVITDFEPYSAYTALLRRIKCITIDNQHIFLNTEIDRVGSFFTRLPGKSVMKMFSPKSDVAIISSFFKTKIKKKSTFIFPPIVRDEIRKTRSGDGDHFLVYLSSPDENVIDSIKSLDEKFILYGLNKEEKIGNIELKKFDEKEFIRDLAGAKGVICNGGITTIGEALYLHKPILSVPITNHYEQELNAYYVEKMRYGMKAYELSPEVVSKFMSRIPELKKRLGRYPRSDNKEILKKIDSSLN